MLLISGMPSATAKRLSNISASSGPVPVSLIYDVGNLAIAPSRLLKAVVPGLFPRHNLGPPSVSRLLMPFRAYSPGWHISAIEGALG
ncbi:hypothetical protein AWB82_06646 [Caballeronia glebae]|uniref:Uncharacterized protein n=1 Tax=Caballeronia glebae TaxID=1777143 RepID=A0A158DE16_9BURK|nr:hypothetical protein AWB82_06646 [Caballeronia glebae]